MYRLEIIDKQGRKLYHALPDDNPIVTVGRSNENDLVLADRSVSRWHAKIHINGDNISIEDLNSANGVVVNFKRIKEITPIKQGDEIVIGETKFTLKQIEDEPTDSPTIVDAPC